MGWQNESGNRMFLMAQTSHCSRLSTVITWIVLLFMPLSTYTTRIEGITIGDVLVLLGTLLVFIDVLVKKRNLLKIVATPLLIYASFIVIHSLIFWMVKPYELTEGLLGVIRYLVYLSFGIIGAKCYFDYDYGYRIYKRLAVLFALYCIAQYFSFRFLSTILPTNLFGLPTVDYVSRIPSSIDVYLSGDVLYRPRSVFLEPSYFAVYEIPILYLILNNKTEKPLRKYGSAVLITASIFLAGTTTGILLQFLCWCKPIFAQLKRLSFDFVYPIIILLPAAFVFISSDYWRKVSNRIISSDGALGASVIGSLENYAIFFGGSLSYSQLFFGQGKWVSVGYLPSYWEMVLSFGLVGLLVFFVVMLLTYLDTGTTGKAMTLLYCW